MINHFYIRYWNFIDKVSEDVLYFLNRKVVENSRQTLIYKGFDANGTKTFPKENQSNDERNEQATNEISAKDTR